MKIFLSELKLHIQLSKNNNVDFFNSPKPKDASFTASGDKEKLHMLTFKKLQQQMFDRMERYSCSDLTERLLMIMLNYCHLWRTNSTSRVHTRGRNCLHVWCTSRKFPESRTGPDSHESELQMWRLFTWWWIKTSPKNSPNLWISLVTPSTTWRRRRIQNLWLTEQQKS